MAVARLLPSRKTWPVQAAGEDRQLVPSHPVALPGVGGHLTALRRTRIGPFGVDGASVLEDDLAAQLLAPSDVATRLFERVDLTAELAVDLGHGKRIALGQTGPGTLAAVAPDGRLVGLVENVEGRAHVLVNFPPEASP